MPLYRLEPAIAYISDEDWSASTHKKDVLVEAASEKQARQIAHDRFWIATSKTSDGSIPLNPWKDHEKVHSTEVDKVPPGMTVLKGKP